MTIVSGYENFRSISKVVEKFFALCFVLKVLYEPIPSSNYPKRRNSLERWLGFVPVFPSGLNSLSSKKNHPLNLAHWLPALRTPFWFLILRICLGSSAITSVENILKSVFRIRIHLIRIRI
jgi:hypothetical protein